MGLLGDLVKAVADVVASDSRRGAAPSGKAGRRSGRRPASTPTARSSSSAAAHGHPAREQERSSRADAEVSPGESGPSATAEVDPHRIGPVRTYLAVQLTSKDHDGEGDFVPVGAGGWDGEHRPSWANLDRVIRVHEDGMRREAAALPREPFERVKDRLQERYGWG
jgi:hypothetical protein